MLNLIPDLPAMVGRTARSIAYQLLYPDKAAVKYKVDRILPDLTTLAAKWELVSLVGHREGRGRKLVPEDVAKGLEQEWCAGVRGASVNQLVSEPELLRTLYFAHREVELGEVALSVDPDPLLTAAILRSARDGSRSQAVGSRAVTRPPWLHRDALVELYGDEATLRTRLDELRHSKVKVDPELMSLTDQYVTGWRSDDFEN